MPVCLPYSLRPCMPAGIPAYEQVELELEELPEMVLRSEPQVVLSWDLSMTPLPLSGGANVPVVLCGPTPVQEYARTHACRRHAANDGPSSSGTCISKANNLVVNCVVSWFEIDLGVGGWLSTGPISSCLHDAPTPTSIRAGCGGHWTQSVQLLQEPAPFIPESGTCLLQARYMVDRVAPSLLPPRCDFNIWAVCAGAAGPSSGMSSTLF
eukprot:366229-Chlamydomonas_euryale.AAC.50